MVTRRAILIGCAGGYRGLALLNGIAVDLKNYEKYLNSEVGGSWRTDEIQILVEPSTFEIRNAISKATEDYVFTVYCGHGSINSYDKFDFINAKDGDLSIVELKANSKKQTIIFEANRKLSAQLKCISIDSLFHKSESGRSNTRELFMEAILDMPQGILLVFSARAGQLAGEDEEFGGHFSYSLLRAGLEWGNDPENHGVLRINEAISIAGQILEEELHQTQEPIMAGQVRRLTFPPFAIAKTLA